MGSIFWLASSCFAEGNATEGGNQNPVIPSLKKLYPTIEVKGVEDTPVKNLEEITFGAGKVFTH